MLPTPSTSHLSFENIYEPSEDSYLLLDAVSQSSEASFLRHRFHDQQHQPCPLILEVGTGSGIVLAFLTTNAGAIFGRHDVLAMGTDVNPFACTATTRTVRENVKTAESDAAGLLLDAVRADLTTPVRPRSIDLLVFNPPYVPSEETPSPMPPHELTATATMTDRFHHDAHLLALATDGGAEGMEVTDRLLEQLPDILSVPRGLAYVLLCKQNKPEAVVKRIKGWNGAWDAQIVRESGKQAGWEKLFILRIARVDHGDT